MATKKINHSSVQEHQTLMLSILFAVSAAVTFLPSAYAQATQPSDGDFQAGLLYCQWYLEEQFEPDRSNSILLKRDKQYTPTRKVLFALTEVHMATGYTIRYVLFDDNSVVFFDPKSASGFSTTKATDDERRNIEKNVGRLRSIENAEFGQGLCVTDLGRTNFFFCSNSGNYRKISVYGDFLDHGIFSLPFDFGRHSAVPMAIKETYTTVEQLHPKSTKFWIPPELEFRFSRAKRSGGSVSNKTTDWKHYGQPNLKTKEQFVIAPGTASKETMIELYRLVAKHRFISIDGLPYTVEPYITNRTTPKE